MTKASRRTAGGATAALVLLAAAAGCGPPPAPAAADRPESAERRAAGGETRQPATPAAAEQADASNEAAPSRCDEQCARRIADAAKILDRARAVTDARFRAAQLKGAGDRFVAAWRGCDLRVPGGADLGCAGAGSLPLRMSEAYAEAGRDDGLIFAYLVAIDPRWRLSESPTADKAPAELARIAERAEQQARAQPAAHGADAALAAAAHARLALGDPGLAAQDAALYTKAYGRSRAEEVALLGVAIARHHVDRGDWQRALEALSPAAGPAGNADLRVKLLWHATRGRALAGLGRGAQADQAFGQVVQLWRPPDPSKPAQSIGHDVPAPMLGREEVLDAVGAAFFFAAERTRERAAEPAVPAYSGPASVKAVNEHVKTKIARWAAERHKRVVQASEAYRKVTELRPVPPVRWVVAATARMGELWADFADAFGGAAVPAPVAADTELAAQWKQATTEASRPLLAKARTAFEACRKAAQHGAVRDEHAERCERWLSEHPAP
ncbi:MAG: hypothetical protein HY744_08115 [Deltaproteobacteria bacterium]|nr:hypothetical protein [Deltaproteobacteria bacterium]